MKHGLSTHYKELKNTQKDITNTQVDMDQAIADQISIAVEY